MSAAAGKEPGPRLVTYLDSGPKGVTPAQRRRLTKKARGLARTMADKALMGALVEQEFQGALRDLNPLALSAHLRAHKRG